MRSPYRLALAVVLAGAAGAGFVYAGVFEIGADSPHWRVTERLLGAVRKHSIKARSSALVAPNLDTPAAITDGAGEYAEMCVDCHLAPGRIDSELRAGLYPRPPDLTRTRVAPTEAFWVIKHGIKMSAMPAWGKSHDDGTIWNMVAFLRRLPDLTPESYGQLVAAARAAGVAHHHGADAEMEGHNHPD